MTRKTCLFSCLTSTFSPWYLHHIYVFSMTHNNTELCIKQAIGRVSYILTLWSLQSPAAASFNISAYEIWRLQADFITVPLSCRICECLEPNFDPSSPDSCNVSLVPGCVLLFYSLRPLACFWFLPQILPENPCLNFLYAAGTKYCSFTMMQDGWLLICPSETSFNCNDDYLILIFLIPLLLNPMLWLVNCSVYHFRLVSPDYNKITSFFMPVCCFGLP